MTFWLQAFHLPPYLLIPAGCWEPSAPPVLHTIKLWAHLGSLIKSLFPHLLCVPKGFASRQLTFIKDSVENTRDKLNSVVPVQNSNARSVRTRCKTVGFLGIVSWHHSLQRHVCWRNHCMSWDIGALFCKNNDFKGYSIKQSNIFFFTHHKWSPSSWIIWCIQCNLLPVLYFT